MTAPKKANNPITRLHMYLNYGLLGLATILDAEGYHVSVVHGRFDSPEVVAKTLLVDCDPRRTVLLLSVPSSFALPWARRACAEARRLLPGLRIIVGGRWVVADDEPWIRGQLPAANEFVPGVAEERIVDIVQGGLVQLQRQPARRRGGIPPLEYALLDGKEEFQPSVEVSRGCGMGCTFCAEANEQLSELKAPEVLAAEFRGLVETYETKDIHPYLEASLFRPSTAWAEAFRTHLSSQGVDLAWRAETRVDALSPTLIDMLAGTGLKVIDLGLESASPAQLARMQKSKKPDVYLRRASDIIRACYNAGVWTKVNVLFFPGETLETIAQTRNWLEEHRQFIKGVSVGPTILFRYGSSSAGTLHEFLSHGAQVVETGALDRDGFAHLHLSRDLSHEGAIELATELSKAFMSARDYFDLKSFSYLPRSLSWQSFQELLAQTPDGGYSFRTES